MICASYTTTASVFIAVLLLFNIYVSRAENRQLCYSGSSLYQLVTMDCNVANSSYTGDWYCVKAEICESFINQNRQCAETRGCATTEQCLDATKKPYDNYILTENSNFPGGMTVKLSCCAAGNYPNDDAVAIDYNSICNSASSRYRSISYLSSIAILLSSIVMISFYSMS